MMNRNTDFPSHADQTRSATDDWAGSVASVSSSAGSLIRSNPLPLALIGVGIGWLALSGSGYDRRMARAASTYAGPVVREARHRLHDATETVRSTATDAADHIRDTAAHAYDRVSDGVSSVQQGARNIAGQASSTTHHYGDNAAHRAGSMAAGFWDMVNEHPLVAGLMGMGLGAAIAASLPSSRVEDRWVGSLADDTTSKVKGLADEALERGSRAARAAADVARDELVEAGEATAKAAGDAARKDTRKPVA